MSSKNIHTIWMFVLIINIISCSPKNISSKYYYKHEKVLDSIEESYKKLNRQTPFNIAFTSKNFNVFSIGITTDTITYIYEFDVNEKRLTDTLVKYKLNAPKVIALVQQMRLIRCTWINTFDYYVDEKKNTLVFMSIKPVAYKPWFSYQKYYILSYFNAPQYFDSEGRLLDKRRQRKLRKINGEIFKRINDKVCYTISSTYR
ncbi:hypothetical protein ACQ33O_07495 [Ferruginibacter sp. SUN002]|uniref:hypothetical protein n=1 Tax=Ferruginibacter sp. SUN002 TaxID=2937789 RepID=UPI003D36E289